MACHRVWSSGIRGLVHSLEKSCLHVCICVCMCMYVCIYIYIYIIYLCVYMCVCLYATVCVHMVRMCVCTYVLTYVCMHVCMHVCMYACMHACMYACMHVCVYEMYLYVNVYLMHRYHSQWGPPPLSCPTCLGFPVFVLEPIAWNMSAAAGNRAYIHKVDRRIPAVLLPMR